MSTSGLLAPTTTPATACAVLRRKHVTSSSSTNLTQNVLVHRIQGFADCAPLSGIHKCECSEGEGFDKRKQTTAQLVAVARTVVANVAG